MSKMAYSFDLLTDERRRELGQEGIGRCIGGRYYWCRPCGRHIDVRKEDIQEHMHGEEHRKNNE